ncbi:MAG: TonB-dependent receptor domain-containing protein [Thermoanaerobaculia bacterium]
MDPKTSFWSRTAPGGLLTLALLSTPTTAPAVPRHDPPERPPAETAAGEQQEPSLETESPEEDEKPAARIEREIVVTAGEPDLTTEETIRGVELEERSVRDLGEALRQRPALSAHRRGPINLDPTVRGLQEGQVAVLMDGTRTFAAGPGRMDSDLAHVNPHALESLRVVKGPYALTWGAGALAAIQAESFRAPFSDEPAWAGEVRAGWGENGSVGDGAATVYRSGERSRFSLTVADRTGDDYEAGDGSVVSADFASRNARWSFGFRPGGPDGATTVEYSGGYQEQLDVDYPGRLLDATYFYTRSHALELDWRGAGGTVTQVRARVYSNRKDHRMSNDAKPSAQPSPERLPPFALDVDLPTESNTVGGAAHAVFRRGGVRFKLGADYYELDQTARRTVARRDTGMVLFRDVVWPDATITDAGLYGQGIWRRAAGEVAATVRVDRMEASAGELSPFFLANTTGDPDQEETEWSAALSGRWRPTADWLLTAGLGRAVRAPSVLERYSDRFPSSQFQVAAEFLGNPDLDPEVGYQLDLGAESFLGPGSVSMALFYRVVEDHITVQPDPSVPRRLPLSPPTVLRYVNGDEATFWGGELGWRQRLGRTFQARFSASYVRGQDETLDEPAFGVPPLTAELGLRYAPVGGRGWADLAILWADDQDRVAEQRLEEPTEGWTRVDLRGGWRILPELELVLAVENVFDEAYSHHLNALNPFAGERIPERGRSASVDLVYGF